MADASHSHSPEDVATLIDIYWKMYDENRNHGRHHETQRTALVSALIGISGVVIGLITFYRDITPLDLPLIFFLFLLGAFGALFSAKQYERYCFHRERSRKYRMKFDELLPGETLTAINKSADNISKENSPLLFDFPLQRFWLSLYIAICILSILLAVIAIFYPIHSI
jgi:hypothetical protein